MTDFPESPEGVAYALMREIIDREEKAGRASYCDPREAVLGLYGVCLRATMRGLEEIPAGRMLN